jgi:hypothetical protein
LRKVSGTEARYDQLSELDLDCFHALIGDASGYVDVEVDASSFAHKLHPGMLHSPTLAKCDLTMKQLAVNFRFQPKSNDEETDWVARDDIDEEDRAAFECADPFTPTWTLYTEKRIDRQSTAYTGVECVSITFEMLGDS